MLTIHQVRHNIKAMTDDELEILELALKKLGDNAAAQQFLEEVKSCRAYRATYRSPPTL